MENKGVVFEYLVLEKEFKSILEGKKKALIEHDESFLLPNIKEGDTLILKEVLELSRNQSNRTLTLKISYVEHFPIMYISGFNIIYFDVLEGENI